jgi:hypothetical protein
MKKKILKLNIDLWFQNRLVRLCTAAARGFLIDIKMLSYPSGYLISNDSPLSDEQIAILTGVSVAKVREYIKELAEAKAFKVDENGLFFPDMVADYKFKENAKVSGAVGAVKKKAKTFSAKLADITHTEPLNATIITIPQVKTEKPTPQSLTVPPKKPTP